MYGYALYMWATAIWSGFQWCVLVMILAGLWDKMSAVLWFAFGIRASEFCFLVGRGLAGNGGSSKLEVRASKWGSEDIIYSQLLALLSWLHAWMDGLEN